MEPWAWGLLVLVPLLVIEAVALFHLIARRPDLGVAGKARWGAGILLIPFVGALVYVLLRPPGLASGKASSEEPTAGSTMERLRELMSAHDAGDVSDADYARAKSELFGL